MKTIALILITEKGQFIPNSSDSTLVRAKRFHGMTSCNLHASEQYSVSTGTGCSQTARTCSAFGLSFAKED